jgi:probable phosphoglycerate mutase
MRHNLGNRESDAPKGGLAEPASPFFFLRHGESANNRLDIVNGWTDCPLSDAGRDQARSVAGRLAGQEIAVIYTSPLLRARETAEIVADAAGARIVVLENLKERNWGALENRPRAELTDYFMVPAGGESWEVYRARVWQSLCAAAMPAHALIVGHAGTMRVLRYCLGIGDVTSRVPNAHLLRFAQVRRGAWSFDPV